MRVVISGAASMSGTAIVRELVARGHDVHAMLRRTRGDYPALTGAPWRSLGAKVTLEEGVAHGSDSLTSLLERSGADALVVHAHPMTDFRSADYSVAGAVEQMTAGIDDQLAALAAAGGSIVMYSGTVFEPDNGSVPRPAISRYGVSKQAVFEIIRLAAHRAGLDLRKVVISNPFGPGETGRFGNYLASSWREGATPEVRTPLYIRDNIPATELAMRYVDHLEAGSGRSDVSRPSGYIENQRDFALRVAREIGSRLGRELPVAAAVQTSFDEPLVLVNDGSRSSAFASREAGFWDEYSAGFA